MTTKTNQTCFYNKGLISILLVLLIASTLVYSDFFISKSLTSYYLYCGVIALIAVYGGIVIMFNNSSGIMPPLPIVISLGWAFYVCIHGPLINEGYNSFYVYLLLSNLLFVSIYYLLKFFKYNFRNVFILITFLALIETVVCFLQVFNILDSQSQYFPVTGTWQNPNVTGMYLGMSFPAVLNFCFDQQARIKKGALLISALIIVAIVLLKCRTALIGVSLVTLVLVNYKFKITGKLVLKRNRSTAIIVLVIFIGLVTKFLAYSYHSKKESADNRVLIWINSAKMATLKPVFGYGYGMFEPRFNIYQSQAVQGTFGDSSYKHAGYIQMSYNEFLEHWIQGGSIGALFLCSFLIVLVALPLVKRRWLVEKPSDPPSNYFVHLGKEDLAFMAPYLGVLLFICMSLVNFTFQAIPVMCLFILYCALVSTHAPYNISFSNNSQRNLQTFGKYGIGVCLTLSGIFFIRYTVITAHNDFLNNKASLMAKGGDFSGAIAILSPLSESLGSSAKYWMNYGDILYQNKDLKKALVCLNRAKTLTSTPNLYMKLAKCYEELGNNGAAEANYIKAKYINTSLLTPRFALMQLYRRTGNNKDAWSMAKEILLIKPKVISYQTAYFQRKAFELIKNHSNRLNFHN